MSQANPGDGESVEIHRLASSDSGAVAAIIAEIRDSGAAFGLPKWTLAEAQTEIAGGVGLGLFRKAELCSFILARDLGEEIEIVFLGSKPSVQRQGLMRKLLLAFIAGSKANEIWLETHSLNAPATALYLAAGFAFDGRRKAYYSDGGDALLMSLKAP